MFDNYPKQRPELLDGIKKIYTQHYIDNRKGSTKATGISQKMESWLHRKVAADVTKKHTLKTLEIGAGNLNHLQYESTMQYDIIEPFVELYTNSESLDKVRKIFSDIDEIDKSESYNRIISIATFEHILDLPKVIAKACLLLDPDGCLRTSIPNEGTFLWKLGWQLTTGIEFRLKYGYSYKHLMQHEHVNTANEIEQLLQSFFEINKCSTFGISKSIGLYRFFESRKPKKDFAVEYLLSLTK